MFEIKDCEMVIDFICIAEASTTEEPVAEKLQAVDLIC